MQEELTTPIEGITVPPDEIIKLNCLQMAIDYGSGDPLAFAKGMYEWIKSGSQQAEKWGIVSNEANNKTATAEEPKE